MSAFRHAAQPVHDGLAELLFAAQSDLHGLLTRLDPWDRAFADKAWQGIADITGGMWPQLHKLMPGHSKRSVLQQAWAARFHARVHIGLLYRAGLADPELADEAARLHAITTSRWSSPLSPSDDVRHRGLVGFLMAANAREAGIPDLGKHTRYRGSIRLRYRVASVCEQGAGLSTAINTAAGQPAATAYQKRIELGRAVHAARLAGRAWQPLSELSFSLLNPAAQKLVHSVAHLWPLIFSKALASRPQLEDHLGSLMAERERIEKLLMQVVERVRLRDLAAVPGLMNQLPDTSLVRAMGQRLRKEPWGLQANLSHPSNRESFGPWKPMPQSTLDRLQTWAPSPLPVWWALQPSELARAICAGELEPSSIQLLARTPQDLAPMHRSWSDTEQRDLIRAGHVRLATAKAAVWDGLSLAEMATAVRTSPGLWTLVLANRLDQLPSASPWLALMAGATEQEAREMRQLAQAAIACVGQDRWNQSWSTWVASSYGCPGWDRIESICLAKTVPIKDVMVMFAAGQQPLYPDAFRQVVARSLHHIELLPPRPMLYIKRWIARDPASATALADHGPVHWVQRLVANTTTPLAALDTLIASEGLPAPLRRLAWRNRIARTRDAQTLAELSARMPANTGHFDQLNQWMVQGTQASTAMALVLTARRDGPRLLQLHQRFGDEVFITACREAAQLLRQMAQDPTSGTRQSGRHDAAALELLGHLGAQAAPHLMPALALCRSQQPAGCKLDGAYAQHRIPKKNGTLRLIHAPHPALRKAQRLILDQLLAPLGAHPAVCGFVADRSIVHNALPHVGQAVVVNADIKNCFPSVRWPLVLGALRRELGHSLSPAALSLLVDLSTAGGALPVGAPTSPALLNLVLRRTDETLHSNAERAGLRYTRYADDLTFSGNSQAVGLLRLAERTLAQIGLTLDPAKTNVFRRGRRQMVTGLVVNNQVSVPRAARRRLRAAVHRVELKEQPHWNGQPQSMAALRGRLAFVSMVCKPQAQPLVDRLQRALAQDERPDSEPPSPQGSLA